MDNDDKQGKKQKLIRKMKKERGYLPPAWTYMVEHDIDFMEAYDIMYELALTDGKALPAKYREFIAIGILAFRGQDNAVYLHIKRALKLGATRQEVLDAIKTTIVPGGVPAFGVALAAFMKVEEEGKKASQHG